VCPYVRLAKIIGTGLCIMVFTVTLIFLGYRGRKKDFATIPETIKAQSEYAVPYLVVVFGASIAGVVLMMRLQDVHHNQKIEINRHMLKITVGGDMKAINLKQADTVSFLIMPLFHKLFNDRFHRIGRLLVVSKGHQYLFYFPVRNDGIAHVLNTFITNP
jgi:hypothetical protein